MHATINLERSPSFHILNRWGRLALNSWWFFGLGPVLLGQDIVIVVGDSNLQKKGFTWYTDVRNRFHYNFMVYTEASVSITPEESIKQMKVSSPFPSSSGPLCARCINSRISYTNFHQLLVISVLHPLSIISQWRVGSSDIGYQNFPRDVRRFEFVPQIGEFHIKICHCTTLVDS